MVQHLLAGMQAVSNKVVNFNKLREVTQDSDENPALLLSRLPETLIKCAKLDLESSVGAMVLVTYFIPQLVLLRRKSDRGGSSDSYPGTRKNGL